MLDQGRPCVRHLDQLLDDLNAAILDCAPDHERLVRSRALLDWLRFESCPVVDRCAAPCASYASDSLGCEDLEVVRAVRAALTSVQHLDGLAADERFARLRHARDVVAACRDLVVSARSP